MKTKSSILKAWAKRHGIKIVSFKPTRMKASDLRGLPVFKPEKILFLHELPTFKGRAK